jgi:hypothetical protein
MTYEHPVANLTVGGPARFMDDLPTRYVTNVLRGAEHRQTP